MGTSAILILTTLMFDANNDIGWIPWMRSCSRSQQSVKHVNHEAQEQKSTRATSPDPSA